MNFKEALASIRRFYFKNKNSKKITTGLLGAGLIVGLLMDLFLPFSPIFNYLRLFPAAAIAVSAFIFSYINLFVIRETKLKSQDISYVTLKDKYPPKVRNLYAAIIASFIVVLMVANNSAQSPIYTLLAGLCLAILLLLLNFISLTEKEIIIREQGGIDSRDATLNKRLEKIKRNSEKNSEIRAKSVLEE